MNGGERERDEWLAGMAAVRREIHAYPEPGWAEYRTAALAAQRLSDLGFEVATGRRACRSEARMGVPVAETLRLEEERALRDGVDPFWLKRMEGGHTAVVGVLRGGKPGPVTALRFDMDCVEVAESGGPGHAPQTMGFASRRPGLMHACGHDGHIAIGLGVAERLAGRAGGLAGEVRLLFQPAEEGCRGARSMVEAGWLDDADYLFCGHIGLKSRTLGEIVASAGSFLSTAKLDATFRGKAAHAGEAPEQGGNALLAACAAALHLHGISRHGGGPTRINVGLLEGGSGRNVVPAEARMKLETRGGTEALNDYMVAETRRILEASAQLYGVSCEVETVGQGVEAEGDPALIPAISRACAGIAAVRTVVPTIAFGASEDATHMMRRVRERGGKAAYMLFGSPLAEGHHHPSFDFDERVMGIAAELLVRLVWACSRQRPEDAGTADNPGERKETV